MGKLDMRTLFFAGFLTSCVTSAALACSPLPGDTSEKYSPQDLVFAIAKVKSVSVAPSADGGACQLVSYVLEKAIFGTAPGQLSVQACDESFSVEKMRDHPLDSEMGFVSGASVMVGLVRPEATGSGWEYVTGCWGPLHLRLDTLTKNERSTFIHAINKLVQDFTLANQFGDMSTDRRPTAKSRPDRKPKVTSPDAKKSAALSAGTYVVQLAARKSKADALAVFADFQKKYPGLLDGYGPIIQRGDLGNNAVWYRLNVGPIESKKAASSLCGKLKSAGMRHCLVRRQ